MLSMDNSVATFSLIKFLIYVCAMCVCVGGVHTWKSEDKLRSWWPSTKWDLGMNLGCQTWKQVCPTEQLCLH